MHVREQSNGAVQAPTLPPIGKLTTGLQGHYQGSETAVVSVGCATAHAKTVDW
jgi:hypothetical protein